MAFPKDKLSDLVSAALLHDVGEIILLSLEKEKMGRIQKYTHSKEISASLSLEEAAFGITHTSIGVMVAEKWKFPAAYSKVIEYHHRPLQIEAAYRDLVFPIYLADMMIKIGREEALVSEVASDVLRYCKIGSANDFNAFLLKTKANYKEAGKIT
jgi:HD-like signal output (HDOD) protein